MGKVIYYSPELKLEVIDKSKGIRDADIAEEYGITRRTIIKWRGKEDEIRKLVERKDIKDKVTALDGELDALRVYEKKYLDKLEDIGVLEDRKKEFVGGIEKVMWDHLNALDGDMADMKPDVRVRMLKDLNDIRERLSGDPSVIIEYRNKYQMNVMMVVKDMMPGRAKEFIERVNMLENVS